MNTKINAVIEKLEAAIKQASQYNLRAAPVAQALQAASEQALSLLRSLPEQGEPVDMIHNDYDVSVSCSNCGTDGGFGMYDDLEWAKFCPGCGRPIARQIDAKGNITPHPLYAGRLSAGLQQGEPKECVHCERLRSTPDEPNP